MILRHTVIINLHPYWEMKVGYQETCCVTSRPQRCLHGTCRGRRRVHSPLPAHGELATIRQRPNYMSDAHLSHIFLSCPGCCVRSWMSTEEIRSWSCAVKSWQSFPQSHLSAHALLTMPLCLVPFPSLLVSTSPYIFHLLLLSRLTSCLINVVCRMSKPLHRRGLQACASSKRLSEQPNSTE